MKIISLKHFETMSQTALRSGEIMVNFYDIYSVLQSQITNEVPAFAGPKLLQYSTQSVPSLDGDSSLDKQSSWDLRTSQRSWSQGFTWLQAIVYKNISAYISHISIISPRLRTHQQIGLRMRYLESVDVPGIWWVFSRCIVFKWDKLHSKIQLAGKTFSGQLHWTKANEGPRAHKIQDYFDLDQGHGDP